jgi:hypothetical protein
MIHKTGISGACLTTTAKLDAAVLGPGLLVLRALAVYKLCTEIVNLDGF